DQAGSQRFYARCRSTGRPEAQVANARHLHWLLGACGDWRSEDAADEPNEFPPPHSITSSARASSDGGTVSPSAFAVLRLITSSSLVGNSNGISLGADSAILRCLRIGVALHHGALPTAYRKEIERLLRENVLKV